MSGDLRRRLLSPFVLLPLVAVLALAGWVVLRPDESADTATTTTPTTRLVAATRDTMAQTVTGEGTVEAAEVEDLSFSAAGTVTAVNVAAGDEVHAGDVLATIDSAELAATVAEAEASVADAEAALEEALDAGATDAQIAADESSLEVARDQLEAAQEALTGAQLVATIDGAVAAVNLTVGEQLSTGGTGGTATTGSESGSGQSAADLGAGATGLPGVQTQSTEETTSEAHIQVTSTGRYAVELGFDDTDIANLATGQEARVTLSTGSSATGFPGGGFPGGGFPGGAVLPGGGAFPGAEQQPGAEEEDGDASAEEAAVPDLGASTAEDTPVNGFVSEVGTVADASSGVASYPVTVVFTDDSGELIPGATASVEITYAETDEVVQVLSQAVTTADGASTVTVDLDGEAGGETEVRPVTTGLTAGSMTEITDGLEPGEQVVVALPGGRGGGFTPPEGLELPAGAGGGGS